MDTFWETLLCTRSTCRNAGKDVEGLCRLGFKESSRRGSSWELRLEGCPGVCQADKAIGCEVISWLRELPGWDLPSYSPWITHPIQPRPWWHCLPLGARPDGIIYDYPSRLLETTNSTGSFRKLFLIKWSLVSVIQSCRGLNHLWIPIKILFPYFAFMITGISFLRKDLRKWACLGGSQALGRVGYWGSLSSKTGIMSWQHPSRSCGPFSTEGIFSRTSCDSGETAVGLWRLERWDRHQRIWIKT